MNCFKFGYSTLVIWLINYSCNIPMIRICEIDIGNPKLKRHSRNWFRYETFYYLFELKVFRNKERERHNLSMLTAFTSSALNPTNARRPLRTNSSGLAQLWISRSEAGTQLTAFSQIPKILSPRFWCMTSFTPPGLISYLGFYFDIYEWRILPARAWTPALMFAPN